MAVAGVIWSCLCASTEWLRWKLIAYRSGHRCDGTSYAFVVVRHGGCMRIYRYLEVQFVVVVFLTCTDLITLEQADLPQPPLITPYTTSHLTSSHAQTSSPRVSLCRATSYRLSQARVKIQGRSID